MHDQAQDDANVHGYLYSSTDMKIIVLQARHARRRQSGQILIISCLTHQEVLIDLVTNGGCGCPFLAVTWRAQPSFTISEHVPVYANTSLGALLLSM